MIPTGVMEECRLKAHHHIEVPRGLGRIMAAVIVLVWVILAGLGYVTCDTLLEINSVLPEPVILTMIHLCDDDDERRALSFTMTIW